MNMKSWEQKYTEILEEFGYSREKDEESAKILDSILTKRFPLKRLSKKIEKQVIFVIGAGPSLSLSIPILKKFKNITKIVADGATKALIENRVWPDIVVSDLDGDVKFLKKANKKNAIMIVHSHGDNQKKLGIASKFKNCIGTTEGKPFGKISNFGGFTDGDRCFFLARHFKAKKIILFGMEFGTKIGRYSKPQISNKSLKIKKLRKGKELVEWLALKDDSGLYTTSKLIKGFKKIDFASLEQIVST